MTARQMLASCQRELRGCIWDLRTRTLEERDLTEAILRSVRPHVETAKMSVRFGVPCPSLSEPLVHAILHIVRELASNAVRHGHATHVSIEGERRDGKILFTVSDNGSGFDPTGIPGAAEGHFGLLGIRERLRPFKGTLSIVRSAQGGMRIAVSMNDHTEKEERLKP